MPLGILVGLTILLVPWFGWWRITTPNPHLAVAETPVWLFAIGMCLVYAAWVWQKDRWFGALFGWVAVRTLTVPQGFYHTLLMGMGIGAILLIRHMETVWRTRLIWCLVGGGLLQVAYVVHNALGYDVLWAGLSTVQTAMVRGTTGNSVYVGAYLALLAPLGPLWAVPFFVVGVALSKSLLAMGAIWVGLAVRYPQGLRWTVLVGLSASTWMLMARMDAGGLASSLSNRLDVWKMAWNMQTPLTWIIGNGPASWGTLVLPKQQALHVWPTSLLAQAHNEWIQAVFEFGLVGLVLIGGWLWAHRALWRQSHAGSMFALVVLTLGFFPFHIAVTGTLALMVMACATVPQEEDVCETALHGRSLGWALWSSSVLRSPLKT